MQTSTRRITRSIPNCTRYCAAIIRVPANELVATIHDRMPATLRREDFDPWLGLEPDPRDLLRPFPSELLRMWPISTRVNSPNNDDEHLLDGIELPDADNERPARSIDAL
jgi:putative SOS response-associated peptidase YedK